MKCMVNMKIYEVKERTELLMEQLLKVWEESVRATHQFLSEKEIEKIKEYVLQALAGVQSLVIAVNASGEPIAFMGIEDHRLEMLFLSPKERGKGLGKQLAFMSIWALKHTKGQIWMRKEIPIPFCI